MAAWGLTEWAGASAAVCAVGGLLAVAMPGATRAGLTAFPRQRLAGWALTVVVLLWSGHLLFHGPLGFLEPYKHGLYGLVPLSIVLVGVFVDELLAARALGGLLILLPAPMLAAARFDPQSGRYLVIALAYAMAIGGATLIAVPYVFRKACERWAATDGGCRRIGGGVLALAAGLATVAAGWW